jgi:hypothetical protein
MTRLFLFLALTASLHADGLEAYKKDFLLKQLPQIMKGGITEEERKLRMATLDLAAWKNFQQLTDERKFYWEWVDTYGLNATQDDKDKLRKYTDSHFSLGKRISNQTYEDYFYAVK